MQTGILPTSILSVRERERERELCTIDQLNFTAIDTSEDPKSFLPNDHVCPEYRDRQTDRQTDRQSDGQRRPRSTRDRFYT